MKVVFEPMEIESIRMSFLKLGMSFPTASSIEAEIPFASVINDKDTGRVSISFSPLAIRDLSIIADKHLGIILPMFKMTYQAGENLGIDIKTFFREQFKIMKKVKGAYKNAQKAEEPAIEKYAKRRMPWK